MFQLAFSSNAFRKYSIEEAIAIVAGIGYEGIELMCDAPHAWPPDLTPQKITSIKSALTKHRLELSNLNAFMMCALSAPERVSEGAFRQGDFHHPSWIEPDAAYRRKRIEHTAACVKLAEALGAKNLSTEPGGPLPEGITRADALALFKEGLLKVARDAERRNVRILIEPEPGHIIQRSREFDEFIREIDSPAVGLNFDLGHLYCVGEDLPSLIRHWRGRIGHIHLEDIAATREHFHLPPGDGAIDFAAVFRALREIEYRGWVTIELYPFQQNAPEVAKRAFEFVQETLRRL